MVAGEGEPLVAGAVVRLRNGDEVVGGGFHVGPGLIATCAHVAADAVGADPYSPSAPAGPVQLDFPLVADGARLDAVVERWLPIAGDGTGDIALLRLLGPAPSQARTPPLRRIDRLWDHRFRVLGFPEGRPDGVWSSGLIRGEQSTRWFQLQSTAGEQRIEGGFSGSPVWDVQSGAVVGMTVAADRGDTTTAYLIPIDKVLGLDPALLPCPYRGLRPFEEEHAATFFGRAAETDKLVDAVGRLAVVVVAGPSGAGKSSLVRAGLLPRLRAAGTSVVDVRALPDADLSTELTGQDSVLVLDQFEELAAVDPAGARRLLEQVVRLTGTERAKAVLTVRWAALDEVVTPELIGVVEKGSVLVAPMSRSQLREAIVGPAECSPGLAFEPGLVDRILDDAGTEPGQLPLVEALLTDLWDRREGGHLTVRGYEAAGGVAGAVAEHAERAIEAVGTDPTETVRPLFLALARPDRDGRLVRRAVPLAQLPAAQRALVSALADRRLLVVGPSGVAGGTTVELAHQALIDHWPRLRAWLAEDSAFLSWRDRVDGQRERWEAEDRADAALLRGATLVEAADWLPAREADISPGSAEYLRRSRARRRWEVRRWRVVTAVLAVLGLVAATLAVIALDRRQVLADQLATAAADSLASESRNRAPADVALGAQLALAAWRADPTHPQARTALAASYVALQSADTEVANLGTAAITQLDAAGDTAVLGGPPRPVAVTGVAGEYPRRDELPETAAGQHLALSPDGRWLADVTPDRTAIRLHDLSGAAEPRTLPSTGVRVGLPRFAPDGRRLMWVTADATDGLTLTVWDLRSDAEVAHRLGVLGPDPSAFWLTPDPNLVLVRTGDAGAPHPRLALRSLADGAEVAAMPAGAAVVERGAAVATCAKDGSAPAVVTVTAVGAPTTPLRIPTVDTSCRHWISVDGGSLIEKPWGTEPGSTRLRITDLRSGATREFDVPPGVLDDPSAPGFTKAPTIAVVRTPARPTVLVAHHGSLLRLTAGPTWPAEQLSGPLTDRTLSDDGDFVVGRVGDALVVEDPGTGKQLATVPGAVGEGSKAAFGTEVWVVSPGPDGWTLTRYDIPTLHRTASFRLPTSADPATASPMEEVAVADVETPNGRQLLSISDGLLAASDPRTGRPLGPPTPLGESPEERRWFQLVPVLAPRPGHPGQALVADRDGAVQVWDAVRGRRLQTIPTAHRPVPDFLAPKTAVDRAGSRLAVLTSNKTIEVWDIDTATLLGSPIPASRATDLAGVDAEGHLVVVEFTTERATELRFIDLDGRTEAGSVVVEHGIDDMVGDGSAVRLDGVAGFPPRLLPLTARAWRDKLCSVLDRPFTPPELAILPPGTDTEPPCSATAGATS